MNAADVVVLAGAQCHVSDCNPSDASPLRFASVERITYQTQAMEPPNRKELGLNKRGFPPTDESGDVDVNQIEWNLRLTPAERVRRTEAGKEFIEAARHDRIRRYGFDPAS